MSTINFPAAPNIPLAPTAYERLFQDQMSNVLRLYFNRLSANLQAISGAIGGKYLSFPYAAIQRTTNKTFTANTATQITFDQNDFLSGCSNSGLDGIVVSQSGIYNYQFSVQFENSDTQVHSAWIWLKINGINVPGTASKFDIISSHGGIHGFVIAACNFYVQLQADDTVEMWAAVDNTGVSMTAAAAQTSPFSMPAIPSVVATLSFLSTLPG